MLITIDKNQIMEMAEDWLNKTVNREMIRKQLVSVETKTVEYTPEWVLVLEDYEPDNPQVPEVEIEGS